MSFDAEFDIYVDDGTNLRSAIIKDDGRGTIRRRLEGIIIRTLSNVDVNGIINPQILSSGINHHEAKDSQKGSRGSPGRDLPFEHCHDLIL